ncbi:hypothetical protein OV203_28925 [Nannocystis sp. ILAH1]|uniref:hypothetical protein n=1 Tax=unclassified Nannocystis TaxID=2627009 RepID=UPI00226DEA7B|nr:MULTISPECIES: hypothetical protein [unclassified Nannocystis]MCY0991204.1 hypothetical protein [Nannocystis sp. ILAH1]MCY1064718.1 hypothetical protein [Nannocystis sp. RBIL2]
MFFKPPSEEATRAIEAAYARPAAPTSPPTEADWRRLAATVERVCPGERRAPLPEAALAGFEAHHGVVLPAEFRRFKRTIGDYGARIRWPVPWDQAIASPWGARVFDDAPGWGDLRGGTLGLDGHSD